MAETLHAYIDFNRDGDFSDPNEDVTQYLYSLICDLGAIAPSLLPGAVASGSSTGQFRNGTGFFSKDNPASPFYGIEASGLTIRYTSQIDANPEVVIWQGELRTITETADIVQGASTVSLYAVDIMTMANEKKVSIAMATSTASGALIGAICDKIGIAAGQRTLAAGQTTLQRYWTEDTISALRAMREIEMTEGGRLWVSKAGKLVFEDRSHDPAATVAATYEEGTSLSFNSLTKQGSKQNVYTSVKAVAHAWNVSQNIVLWQYYGKPISLAAAASTTIWTDMPNPKQPDGFISVDEWNDVTVTANANEDGSGADLSADIAVVQTKFAKTQKLVLTNNGAGTAYIRVIDAYGVAVIESSRTAVRAGTDDTRVLDSASRFLGSVPEAQDWCNHILAISQDEPDIITIRTPVHGGVTYQQDAQAREIADLIHITCPSQHVNGDFFVMHMSHSWVAGREHWMTLKCISKRTHVWGTVADAYAPQEIIHYDPADTHLIASQINDVIWDAMTAEGYLKAEQIIGQIIDTQIANVSGAKLVEGSVPVRAMGFLPTSGALNPDPNCTDETAWVTYSGSNWEFATVTDGKIGNSVIRSTGAPGYAGVQIAQPIPISHLKSYLLHGAVRRKSGDRRVVFFARLLDSDGLAIDPTGLTGWPSYQIPSGGARVHWTVNLRLEQLPVGGEWQDYYFTCGYGGTGEIPENAKSLQIGAMLNFSGAGDGTTTDGVVEIQDFWIKERIDSDKALLDGIIGDSHVSSASSIFRMAQNTLDDIAEGAEYGKVSKEVIVGDGMISINAIGGETPAGAQQKADAAEEAAKQYADMVAPKAIFQETFDYDSIEECNARWVSYDGSGERELAAGGLAGGKVLRIGDNDGNDQQNLIFNKSFPYSGGLHRVTCSLTRTAGDGICYIGVAGRDATDTHWVRWTGSGDAPTAQYYCAANGVAPPLGERTTYIGYFKGHSAPGIGVGRPDPSNPATLHDNVRYFRPLIFVNWEGVPGTYEIDYFEITPVPESLDEIPDGTEYKRVSATNIEAGKLLLASTEYGLTRIANPIGAVLGLNEESVTGAIVITLPQSWSSTMMKFMVDVYNFVNEKSFSLALAGYNYTGSGGMWIRTSVALTGDTTANQRVRFGHDGEKCCIVIGNTNSVWRYPNISIRDFQAGLNNFEIDKWKTGWNISIVADLTGYTFPGTAADYADSLVDAKQVVTLSNHTLDNLPDGVENKHLKAIHLDADTGMIRTSALTGTVTAETIIQPGSITTSLLDFTPVGSDEVIARINASEEELKIASSKIKIDGSTEFVSGYDPSTKIEIGGAAEDINEGSTRIDGGMIETGTILASRMYLTANDLFPDPCFDDPDMWTHFESPWVAGDWKPDSGVARFMGVRRAAALWDSIGTADKYCRSKEIPFSDGGKTVTLSTITYNTSNHPGYMYLVWVANDGTLTWAQPPITVPAGTYRTVRSQQYTAPTDVRGYWVQFGNDADGQPSFTPGMAFSEIRVRIAADAELIVDGAIVTRHIAAGQVTAGKCFIQQLSSLTADLGAVTAGVITGSTFRLSPDANGNFIELSGSTIKYKNQWEVVYYQESTALSRISFPIQWYTLSGLIPNGTWQTVNLQNVLPGGITTVRLRPTANNVGQGIVGIQIRPIGGSVATSASSNPSQPGSISGPEANVSLNSSLQFEANLSIVDSPLGSYYLDIISAS